MVIKMGDKTQQKEGNGEKDDEQAKGDLEVG